MKRVAHGEPKYKGLDEKSKPFHFVFSEIPNTQGNKKTAKAKGGIKTKNHECETGLKLAYSIWFFLLSGVSVFSALRP
jgi:hypothetical protein